MRTLLLLLVGSACRAGDPSEPASPSPDAAIGDPVVDDQLPPTGHAALVPWLAEGHYLGWACEPEPHPARPPGAHGENRICSNTLLSSTADGPYPEGAATVKELVRDGAIVGYAVMRRMTAEPAANGWYWYEAFGASVVADGRSPGLCTSCHDDAPRDFIFTRVPPP